MTMDASKQPPASPGKVDDGLKPNPADTPDSDFGTDLAPSNAPAFKPETAETAAEEKLLRQIEVLDQIKDGAEEMVKAIKEPAGAHHVPDPLQVLIDTLHNPLRIAGDLASSAFGFWFGIMKVVLVHLVTHEPGKAGEDKERSGKSQ